MTDLAHRILEFLIPFFDLFVLALNILSIVVLIWGVIIAGLDFIKNESTNHDRVYAARHNTFIKNYLGSYVLLSLEILIAADIIESIINPTPADLFRLGAVVVIRTVISYFLHKEIEDALREESDESEDTKQVR